METRDLQIFDEVQRQGSFVAAARALDLDPSVVSRSVSGLEAALGIRLFERSTRRIVITEAGATYHGRIAPLLTEIDDAAAEARDLVARPRGTLRVAASTAFGEMVIVPMLAAYREACPDVGVDLRLDDRLADLIAERIDIAVRLTPEAPPDHVVIRAAETRYRVVASPECLHAQPLEHPAALAERDCLRFPLPGFRDLWRFDGPDGKHEVPVRGQILIAGAMALKKAALFGLGPALLADWTIGDVLSDGRLIDPFPEYRVTATTYDTGVWLLRPSRAYLPLKTRIFIDVLRTGLDLSTGQENLGT